MKPIKSFFIISIAVLTLFSCNKKEDNKTNKSYKALKEGFSTPPPEARPKGLWCWINGNFDKEGITEEIREAAEKGMGGLDIWDAPPVTDFNNVVPTGPGYPSDEFMEGVKFANQEALKYGINLGFIWNQSVSYRDPENEVKVLQTSEKIITKSGMQTIQLPVPHAKLGKRQKSHLIEKDQNGEQKYFWDVAVLAFPVNGDTLKINESQIIDLSGKLQKDHSLTWDVPEGKWKIVRYTGLNSGQEGLTPTPATRKPGLDFLDPDATETHLRYLLDMMKKHLGSLDKSAIQYLCSDSYEFTGNKWTEQFPAFFTETYNYSLKNYLPVLFGYSINSKDSTRRILNDYNQLVSELTIKNHYKKCVEVANEYGIGFVSEAAGPGQPLHNVPFESLKACGVLTYPRGEFWHNRHSRNGIDQEHCQIIKGPASAAHIYNQKFVEAESFTSVWLWQEGPADLKPTVDRFFCEGLNLVAFHTFPHTPKKEGLPGYVYGFGTQISENIPWFKMSKPFMEYLGRCSYMLQQGNFIGDFLYFYGDTAPNFVPSKKAEPLFLAGYDYDYINSEVIINSLSVENGKLVLPHGQSYEVLVLPHKNSMELKTLQKVEQLVKEGAWIIGQKPEKGYSLANKSQDAEIKQLADKIWGACNGKEIKKSVYGKGKICWNIPLKEVLEEKGIIPDFQYAGTEKGIDYIHRNVDGIDIYFVSNQNNEKITINAQFRVENKIPERWNAVTGEISDIKAFTSEKNLTNVSFTLEPHGSCFIVFDIKGTGNGENSLVKTSETKNTINLNTGWKGHFTDPWGKNFSEDFETLTSFTNSENEKVKFFSGVATLKKSFKLSKKEIKGEKLLLTFEQPHDVAHFHLNDKDLGIVWTQPYKIDITQFVQEGENQLKIEVANNWANILCGEARKPENERRYHTNISKLPTGWHTPFADIPKEGVPLIEAGIWGIKIEIY